ncbi:hypothetical protein [uncultured Phenylobacterium sp.]|uniref:hypothetical protein n=1 Tax=uncultured Phenylobacterium sp. TaxID=349273 RepID=UPI0025F0B086|nr:hypothetical protein [uncultured Phenylobacterium sp.]
MISWEIVYGLGALVLAGGIVWAILRNRARNRANDPLTEAATRADYDHPEAREEITRKAQGEVRPQ